MTKIKLCGLSRPQDIEAANLWKPEYIGFVFYQKSTRYVSPEKAKTLKKQLLPGIQAVGVFVNAPPAFIARLLEEEIIDAAQLHGQEDLQYLRTLRSLTDKPLTGISYTASGRIISWPEGLMLKMWQMPSDCYTHMEWTSVPELKPTDKKTMKKWQPLWLR